MVAEHNSPHPYRWSSDRRGFYVVWSDVVGRFAASLSASRSPCRGNHNQSHKRPLPSGLGYPKILAFARMQLVDKFVRVALEWR